MSRSTIHPPQLPTRNEKPLSEGTLTSLRSYPLALNHPLEPAQASAHGPVPLRLLPLLPAALCLHGCTRLPESPVILHDASPSRIRERQETQRSCVKHSAALRHGGRGRAKPLQCEFRFPARSKTIMMTTLDWALRRLRRSDPSRSDSRSMFPFRTDALSAAGQLQARLSRAEKTYIARRDRKSH